MKNKFTAAFIAVFLLAFTFAKAQSEPQTLLFMLLRSCFCHAEYQRNAPCLFKV
jgi:hypothetical protein